MKNVSKLIGVIALVAIIGFSMAACGGDGDDNNNNNNNNSNNNNSNQTPVASDYTIGNLSQTAGSVTAVTITPNSGKSTGTVSNIKYTGSATIPQTAGTYAVTFDVAAVTGWNAATNLSAGNLVVTGGSPSVSYIITGSGTLFTATKSGATVGTANQSITSVINAIQTDANGANVAIQFGNGTAILDIDGESAFFGGTWGIITITGKIISANRYTITLTSTASVSINSTADISNRNTAISGGGSPSTTGIYNGGTGTVTISGGTVTALTAIQNTGTGSVIINSGTVSGTGELGSGISNSTNGTVTINGGTVSATSANTSTGAITNHGTVTINGGTVSAPNGCYAILNNLGGTVTISPSAVINGSKSGC